VKQVLRENAKVQIFIGQRGRSSSPRVVLSEAKNLVGTAKIPRSALWNARFAQNDKLLRYFRRAAIVP
jgi:hypothetical protein